MFNKLKAKAQSKLGEMQSSSAGQPPQQQQQHFASSSSASSPFVVARNGSLFVSDQPYRFAGLNSPELLDGDVNQAFEVRNTMQSLSAPGAFSRAVTRTYTLRINSKNIGRGHIKGWNSEWGDWEWDGDRLKEMDLVLAEAGKFGVRLIIPLVNQETSEDTNWVGNTADLIRMRKGGNSQGIDWYTDEEMINSMKLIIDKLTSRVNSITGIKYSDDPTILAWETGNELMDRAKGMRPAPASWTLIIAAHLKSRAPNHLVMDGSFARNDGVATCYAPEVLASPLVDIMSYHYYGSGDIARVKKDCELAKKHGKVFIAGEFGFLSSPKEYASFLAALDSAGGAGALVWSLRPASSRGGYKTHSEGDGQFSYHLPGRKQPGHDEFDFREADIVAAIRSASFKMNKEKVPAFPTPSAPSRPWLVSQNHICWQAGVWAASYELILRNRQTGQEIGRRQVVDCTKEDCHAVDISMELGAGPREQLGLRLRGIGVQGAFGPESEELEL